MSQHHWAMHPHKPGRFFTPQASGKFRCELCPRGCEIKSGQRGFCFVRAADADGIYLDTYGRSSGFCIDPIEKKPLKHFYPGTPILSFGTAGCNLGCKFCQNWDISKAKHDDRLQDFAAPEAIAKAAKESGCRHVAFTYNDPVIFAEYALDTAAACRDLGIHPVAVTAGYIEGKAREEFFAGMDAANIDLKAFTEQFYQKLCLSHLQPVLDTLIYLVHHTDVWVEITTLLIPDENDSEQELEELTQWIAENLGPHVPLHFTAFHPDYKLLDKSRTPAGTLRRARHIAQKNGLHYVYVGNVHDSEASSTYCPQCAHLLIERDWHVLGQWGLNKGACEKCGEVIPGHFENQPDTWGAKRQRLQIIS